MYEKNQLDSSNPSLKEYFLLLKEKSKNLILIEMINDGKKELKMKCILMGDHKVGKTTLLYILAVHYTF